MNHHIFYKSEIGVSFIILVLTIKIFGGRSNPYSMLTFRPHKQTFKSCLMLSRQGNTSQHLGSNYGYTANHDSSSLVATCLDCANSVFACLSDLERNRTQRSRNSEP